MDNINDLLERGIAAAEAGDKEEARRYLSQVIELNPEIEEAWLWLGGIATSPDESLIYFETALALNPRSERARAGIDWAKGRGAKPKPTVIGKEEEPPLADDFSNQWTPRPVWTPTGAPTYEAERGGALGALGSVGGGWLGWLTSGDGKRMALAGAIPLAILLLVCSVVAVRAGVGGGGNSTPSPTSAIVAIPSSSAQATRGIVLITPTRGAKPTKIPPSTQEVVVEDTPTEGVTETPTEEASPTETPKKTATPEESVTPPPTVTPVPTEEPPSATPPATNTPAGEVTPTTAVPTPPSGTELNATVSLGQNSVAPGGFQTIAVKTSAGASVIIVIAYKGGDAGAQVTQTASGTADSNGNFNVRLQTPANAAPGPATVSAQVTEGDKVASATGSFQIS